MRKLPDAELEVLACLWTHGPLTVREIRDRMSEYRRMSHSAASTLLRRLQEKSAVTRTKGPAGKAFVYQAAEPPERTCRRIARYLIERVFVGNRLGVVSALFETDPPDPDELRHLEKLLDQLRSRPARKGKKR